MILRKNRSINSSIIILFIILSLNQVNCDLLNAKVNYHVEGSGFHRKIHYDVEIDNLDQNDCHVALYLNLQSALYTNVDELADLRRRGEVTACSEGETDVEIFAEEADTQNITICAPLKENKATLNLPLHQRYQKARFDTDYVSALLPSPRLLLGCKKRIREYLVSKIDLCEPCAGLSIKWREIPYGTETEEYEWKIPVGNLAHRNYVTYVTLATTTIGTVVVLRALWMARNARRPKAD